MPLRHRRSRRPFDSFRDSTDPIHSGPRWGRARRFVRPVHPAGRIVGAVFGFGFATIGLVLLVSLWSASGFGSPPVFFRLIGSVMALMFLATGLGTAFAAIRGARAHSDGAPGISGGPEEKGAGAARDAMAATSPSSGPVRGSYVCPRCGAGLATGADVSPRGDTKCHYCGTWFNIHEPPGLP